MKYYFINNSLNKKIVGNYNQVQEAIHHCNIWENNRFINNIDFVKIDFEPITSDAVLTRKAKLTDLLNANIIGFSLRLLISDKLKNIVENYSVDKCQFFKTSVIHKNEKNDDYWVLCPYFFNLNYIDFSNSIVYLTEDVFNIIKIVNFDNSYEFIRKLESLEKKVKFENFDIHKFKLIANIKDDFFILNYIEGGIRYIASEKLKQEIEKAGCTGIEFQPIELSYNEWTAPAGEREKVYGKA